MKKRILLCWGYHRKGWVTPFEGLKDEFEFIYLFYRNQLEETQSHTNCRKIYWEDYKSGHEILNQINPDKIILMSIVSGYTIALNISAQKKHIPTYVLQHGLFRTYQEYRAIEKADKINGKQKSKSDPISFKGEISTTFFFLLRSLSFRTLWHLPKIFFYFFLQRKEGIYYASKKIKYPERLANGYLCYTWRNATIYRELDDIPEEKIEYIGVPELDIFFDSQDSSRTLEEEYYLLIDQPFSENQYYNLSVTKEQTNRMYQKLADWCKNNNSRLVIKLHPESYTSDWMLQHPNIFYKRDADVVALVKNAKGIFGTTSTLMLPAVYLKPVFLLFIHNSSFQKRVIELELAKGADFHEFSLSDIDFIKGEKNQGKLKQFEFEYLYKADNCSLERLRNILLK